MDMVKSDKYILTITLGDDVLKGEGNTALQALKSIKQPVKIFTKGTIRLTYKDKKMEQTWLPFRIKRLFYPIAQSLLAKQLNLLLK